MTGHPKPFFDLGDSMEIVRRLRRPVSLPQAESSPPAAHPLPAEEPASDDGFFPVDLNEVLNTHQLWNHLLENVLSTFQARSVFILDDSGFLVSLAGRASLPDPENAGRLFRNISNWLQGSSATPVEPVSLSLSFSQLEPIHLYALDAGGRTYLFGLTGIPQPSPDRIAQARTVFHTALLDFGNRNQFTAGEPNPE